MAQRYEVLDVLGSGGMATVWRARDTDLDRIVAIKRPHPAPAGSDVHARFRREARAAATVSHPNLVTVHDVGVDESGPYLVMEHVDAGSLAEIEWSPALAVTIGSDIANALAALHAAGIVHRDVKPANILVPPGGSLLTDFGIARAAGDPTLTQEGTTFATPAYAAPEVLARGDHSPASDVYALAAVLREMVLGRRATPTGGTQVLITDGLWRPVLDRALAEDADERPTATELAEMIAALPAAATLPPTTSVGLSNTPVQSAGSGAAEMQSPTLVQPVADAERTSRFAPIAAVAAVGALVAAALVLAVWQRGGDEDGSAIVSAGSTAAEESSPGPDTVAPVTEVVAPPDDTARAPATVAPETAAPESPPSTEASTSTEPSDVSTDRDVFIAFVEALDDETMKSKERERLVEDIDKAVAAIGEGDVESSSKEFVDALERIDKRIGDRAVAGDAIALVLEIAADVGVAIPADDVPDVRSGDE